MVKAAAAARGRSRSSDALAEHQRPSYPRPRPSIHYALTLHITEPVIFAARISPYRVASLFYSRRFLCLAAVRLRARRPKGQSLDTRTAARPNCFPSTLDSLPSEHHLPWRSPATLLVDSVLNAATADPILIPQAPTPSHCYQQPPP